MNPSLTDSGTSNGEQPLVPQARVYGLDDATREQRLGHTQFVGGQMPSPKPKRTKLYVSVAAVSVAVLAIAGYAVFALYLPSRPDALFASAMQRTGDGYKTVSDTFQDSKLFGARSLQEKISFGLKADGLATDGELISKGSVQNGTANLTLGVNGVRVKLDTITKTPAKATAPDVYLKASGIKGLGATFGLPSLDTIDATWVAIDHTLIESTSSQLAEVSSPTLPTKEQMRAGLQAVTETTADYLFTADETKQVIQSRSYVGKEREDDRTLHHYKVAINKNNAKQFITETSKALDASEFGAWAKSSTGDTLAGSDFERKLVESVNDIPTSESFDLWIDDRTRLLYKIRLTDVVEQDTYLDLGLDIKDATELPIFINYNVDNDETQGDIAIRAVFNSQKQSMVASAEINLRGTDGFSGSLEYAVEPLTEDVAPTVPANAMPLLEALDKIGLRTILDEYLSPAQTPAELSNQTIEEATADVLTKEMIRLAVY